MALLLCDSFEVDIYNADADFALNGWLGVSATLGAQLIWDSTGDRYGTGGAMKIKQESPVPQVTKELRQVPSGTTIRMAFGLTITNAAIGSGGIIASLQNAAQTGAATRFFHIALSAAGALTISKFDDTLGATVAITATATINDGNPHHIEVELLPHLTTGVLNLWVDGVADAGNIASGDTSDASSGDVTDLRYINLGSGRASNQAAWVWFDDVVVWDDSGSNFTGQLGVHRISVLTPNADGDTVNFTPLSSTNVSNVDEATVDGDTTYNQSVTNGHIDLYGLTSMALSPVTVKAVNVKNYVKDPDVGARTFKAKARENVTTGTGGATFTALPAYKVFEDSFAVNPDTASAWTVDELNAMQIGLEVIS